VPEVKRLRMAGTTAIMAGVCNSALKYADIFMPGWNIILSIITACVFAFIFFRSE
jgi:hypothetical protein